MMHYSVKYHFHVTLYIYDHSNGRDEMTRLNYISRYLSLVSSLTTINFPLSFIPSFCYMLKIRIHHFAEQ